VVPGGYNRHIVVKFPGSSLAVVPPSLVPNVGDFIVGSSTGLYQTDFSASQTLVDVTAGGKQSPWKIAANIAFGQGWQSRIAVVYGIPAARVKGFPVLVKGYLTECGFQDFFRMAIILGRELIALNKIWYMIPDDNTSRDGIQWELSV